MVSTVMAVTLFIESQGGKRHGFLRAQSLLAEGQKGHPYISRMVALTFRICPMKSEAALIKNTVKMLLSLLFR